MKMPSETAQKVASVVVAYLSHNLFDAQESGCQKVRGLVHFQFDEILPWRNPGFNFEKVQKVRWREARRLSHLSQRDASMKISAHKIDHRADSHPAKHVHLNF